MPLTLLTGAPGSGRTTRALDLARQACEAGRRVWWVGLPAQRAYVYRRATADGSALLGLEFLTAQQVYYRLLAKARRLKPLITGSARLVHVGEALAEDAGAVPSPGEARLFAYAIAEAKRFGVASDAAVLSAGDAERERFRRVYAQYESRTQDSWDYDDFRTEALKLAERQPSLCEADMVVLDGFRELGPMELRLFRALAEAREVLLSLPAAPAGQTFERQRRLPPRPAPVVHRYRAANPVAEARWVLRSVKRDLATGNLDPLDIAILTPPDRARAVAALADEYALPLMDETPTSIADTVPGRALAELLDLADYPTPSRLLAVPELADLANAALAAGVAGADAIGALAAHLGMSGRWRLWLATLEVADPPLPWARSLVREVLPEVLGVTDGRPDPADAADPADAGLTEAFVEQALQKAQEAAQLAHGDSFRAWWAALLRQSRAPRPSRGGVALLSATQASGRRFRRVYLLGATEGAYGAGESEDYFIPEEDRAALAESYARLGLPRRFQGRDQDLAEELLARGDEIVVSYPEADQGGPLVPDVALTHGTTTRLPEVPAGSLLELPSDQRYHASREPVPLATPTVEQLRHYDACAFRYWGERALEPESQRPWWLDLIGRMRDRPELVDARIGELAADFPDAAGWLHENAELLKSLRYGVRLPANGDGPAAIVDAAVRDGTSATLYRFTAPERVRDPAEADEYLRDRWTELWAAGHLLERYRGRIESVGVRVWPLLGEPMAVYPRGITYLWRRIETRQRGVDEAYARLLAGDVTPSPGYICRDCPVFDVCREGVRS